MRRRPGQLLPLEIDILEAALTARAGGEDEFHGFAIAKALQGDEGATKLTGHGTLYKALARLEDMRLLESRWEDPQLAIEEGRPPRRLYRLTGAAEVAVARAQRGAERHLPARPGWEPA